MGNNNQLPVSDDYWNKVNQDLASDPPECVCPSTDKPGEFSQVCASNGETYPTFCAFKCAQKDIKYLQFKHVDVCTEPRDRT